MAKQPQSNWVWADDSGGMMGATADLDDKKIMWFDQPGCACGDYEDAQTIADFLAKGPRYLNPPADVLEEMRVALKDYA